MPRGGGSHATRWRPCCPPQWSPAAWHADHTSMRTAGFPLFYQAMPHFDALDNHETALRLFFADIRLDAYMLVVDGNSVKGVTYAMLFYTRNAVLGTGGSQGAVPFLVWLVDGADALVRLSLAELSHRGGRAGAGQTRERAVSRVLRDGMIRAAISKLNASSLA